MSLCGAGCANPTVDDPTSESAAIAATSAGYTAAFNIEGGFEGDVGEDGHRGTVNGWKAAGLPWFQN